jgi:hypothetical protein
MPTTSQAVGYARLLRPFPTKRLADVLYRVDQDGAQLHNEMLKVLADPPGVPEAWCQVLQRLQGLLWEMEDEAREARAVLDEMYLDADRAFDVSVRAMECVLAGMRERGES